MGIIFGLAAALCWGVGDFAITTLARYIGSAKSLFYIQLMSLACWFILLGIFPHTANVPLGVWGMAALAGVFHVIGLVTTYRAFEVGTLSFVSPIASSFAIVTAICFVLSGRAPAPIALAGTCLLVAGVAVVSKSTVPGGTVTLRGVPEAIASAVAFGVMFWIIDVYVREPLGDAYPLILLKVMATTYAALVLAKNRKSDEPQVQVEARTVWMVAAAAALLDSMAWVAALYGYRHANGAVVTALASLFSAFTMVMAWFFLKERLNRSQWVGVVVVLVGILLVSLPTHD